MGVKAPMEMKPTGELGGDDAEDTCPDSWEMADLEESMIRFMPLACSLQNGDTERRAATEKGNDSADAAVQVDEFLREALQNPHDRLTILRLEQEVQRFVRNPKQQQLEFPPMPSSYLRLAAHRVAQHYYLQTSVIDGSSAEGCRILVRKCGEIRFPPTRLADVPVTMQEDDPSMTKFVIKQRPQGSSLSGGDGLGAASGSASNPAKSVEERNEEYNRARARIFRNEMEQRAYDELLEMESRQCIKLVETVRDDVGDYSEHSSTSGRRSNKPDKEHTGKSRQKVAIFRDREKDRKDPDYDRNYDRYSQRFDPGFGLGGQPAFGMQARYTPVVNYNTEFPQLGSAVSQMPGQTNQPQQHLQAWSPAYQPQDMLRGPFNPAHINPQSNMATYMSQYAYPQPSMTYTYSSQISQQPETGSAQARRH